MRLQVSFGTIDDALAESYPTLVWTIEGTSTPVAMVDTWQGVEFFQDVINPVASVPAGYLTIPSICN